MSTMQTTQGNGRLVPFKERVNTFRGTLEKLKPQIALALPRHIKPDRLARIVLTSIQKTPSLLDCTQESLLGAIIQAAQLGLEPDGVLGHAYLIPYKTQCQLIVGYKGMIKLARQSGEISSISAHVVRMRDEFEYAFGLEQRLVHVPARPPEEAFSQDGDGWDPGPVTYVYAVATLKDGTKQFDVMDRWQVEAIRKRSRASNSGPWVTDWEEMAKKTVLRRLCKMLPASVEMQTAVALDERVDAGLSQDFENVIDVSADGSAAAEPAPSETKLDQIATNARARRSEKQMQVVIEGAPGEPATQVDPKTGEVLERQPGEDE